MEDGFDECTVLAATNALHYREVLVTGEAGGTDQDESSDLFRVAGCVGQDDLAAETGTDEVVRGALGKGVEELRELFNKVINIDLAAGGDVIVQGITIVDEHLRYLDVEVSGPVRTVCEPAFRLLGQPVDQHEGFSAMVGWYRRSFG